MHSPLLPFSLEEDFILPEVSSTCTKQDEYFREKWRVTINRTTDMIRNRNRKRGKVYGREIDQELYRDFGE